MSALNDPSVHGPHADGSYTIASDHPGDADWTLRDTGTGWTATHPADGWDNLPSGATCTWATAEDAIQAVLGDPADTVLFGGRRYREAVR